MTVISKGSPADLASRRQAPWGQMHAGLWSWLFTRQQEARRPEPMTLICGPRTREAQAKANELSA